MLCFKKALFLYKTLFNNEFVYKRSTIMAFLDNSGDIILDAVLTDLGRKRLAQGSFNIVKFALGDEEIDYNLYDSSRPEGTAYYDLEILQTPILEAFTSDQSLMKSKLLTLSNNNTQYLPILKINNTIPGCKPYAPFNGFYILADSKTYNVDTHGQGGANVDGILHGVKNQHSVGGTTHMTIDQGMLDNAGTILSEFPGELEELGYIVKVDSRLLSLESYTSQVQGEYTTSDLDAQFIDDDSIATYWISDSMVNSPITKKGMNYPPRERNRIAEANLEQVDIDTIGTFEVFDGPLGSILRIVPKVTTSIRTSEELFDEIGKFETSTSIPFRGGNITKYKYIDTTVSVTGFNTGFSIDIPVRIIKGTNFS